MIYIIHRHIYHIFVMVLIRLVAGKGGALFPGQSAYASTYACQDRSVERSMHAVLVHVHLARRMTRYQFRSMNLCLKQRLETRPKHTASTFVWNNDLKKGFV